MNQDHAFHRQHRSCRSPRFSRVAEGNEERTAYAASPAGVAADVAVGLACSAPSRAVAVFMLLALLLFSQTRELAAQDRAAEVAVPTGESGKDGATRTSLQVMQWTAAAFRQAAARIRPSLVTIESFGGVSAVQGRIGGIRKQGEGNTTGVMISDDGWIITSTFNFIQKPPIITVVTSDGQRHVATMHGRDDTRKLCLLKIEPREKMPIPELADAASLQVGQWAISVGVGFGDVEPAISTGIISALNRVGGRAIQTDANTSPACYGGPLVDIEGKLIGICVPLNPQSQAIGAGVEWYDSGIGFAVPLSGLEDLIQRMKRGEVISPAFMGVQSKPTADQRGLEIEQVVPGSAAEKAGLQVGDVMVQLAGKPIRDLLALRQYLNRYDAGDRVELTFVRGQEAPQTVTLELGTAVNPDESKQLEPPKIR